MALRKLPTLALMGTLVLTACGAPAAESGGPSVSSGAVTTASSQTSPTPTASSPVATPAASSVSNSAVLSDPFGGYSLELPAGTVRTDTASGKWGEVRTTYQTSAGELITTIDFSPDFGWSELSEELTQLCPTASEGVQEPIVWAGSIQGGYTGWDRSSCGQTNIVTFVDFWDEGASVIYDADSVTPARWIAAALESARNGVTSGGLRFLIDHRHNGQVDLTRWAEACGDVFGSAREVATAFAVEAELSGQLYGNNEPVCEYEAVYFTLSDLDDVVQPGNYGWGEFGSDGCRFQAQGLFSYECREGDLVVGGGLRRTPTENDRTQMARIVKTARDKIPSS